jgi:multidrug efflux pump
VVDMRETVGPDKVMHYNVFPSAEISGNTLPGVSSGQAISVMQTLADQYLPTQFGYEWTELSLQEILAGNSALYIFPLCALFVFLVLAAQYESWSLPLAISLSFPCASWPRSPEFLFGVRTIIFSLKSESSF